MMLTGSKKYCQFLKINHAISLKINHNIDKRSNIQLPVLPSQIPSFAFPVSFIDETVIKYTSIAIMVYDPMTNKCPGFEKYKNHTLI